MWDWWINQMVLRACLISHRRRTQRASPERRLTKLPGWSIGQVLQAGWPTAAIKPTSEPASSDLSPIPQSFKNARRSQPPAQLPIKADPNSARFSRTGRFDRVSCQKRSAWKDHHAIYTVWGEEGRSKVTMRTPTRPPTQLLSSTKHSLKPNKSIKCLSRCAHANVVVFDQAYSENGELYLRYELMEITLAQIQATPIGRLEDHHLAAISEDVGSTVWYSGVFVTKFPGY